MTKLDFGDFADRLRDFFGSDDYYDLLKDLPAGSRAGLHAGILTAYGIAEKLILEQLKQESAEAEELFEEKHKWLREKSLEAWWLKAERVKQSV